ncbi:MAG TPA: carboxypeptidase regulatory-like domain-containing protein, partial [Streptosporangiaceae bacterium]
MGRPTSRPRTTFRPPVPARPWRSSTPPGTPRPKADLAAFRSYYGLPPCTTANGCFRKVDQTGGTNYPPDDSGWALETSLDLDAVSAACPACNILLVEANSSSIPDLSAAENEAVALGARFISNSYGAQEDPSELSFDSAYTHPGVAITASTGDTGNLVSWPSSNPNVIAVGGTRLTRDTAVPRGWGETAWSSGGSGCSATETHPDYQNGVTTGCAMRATADISADADPVSGLATYDTLGYGGWLQVGGTSLSSPLTAAMYALAGPPVAGTYPVNYPYHDPSRGSDLFDVTSGTNGSCGNVLCTAGPGWDGPTGLGTPDGVRALAGGPQGAITGKVTDAATGQPIAGVTIAASPGDYLTHTDASGAYALNLAVGSYTVTAAEYAYQTGTQTGVAVTAGQTANASFA